MFEITIRETRVIKKLVPQKWEKIGTKEVPRERDYYVKDEKEPKTRIEDVWGYTPEAEIYVREERDVLKQQVEELDIAAVIKAVNKL